jgi:peptidyl-prolyl cis-trans isomerase D
MFEAVRQNKRISQVILAIIIVPFAFFGMDAYFSGAPGGNEVAAVGNSKISVMEFDRALREQQDRLREATGGQFDRALFESEAFRRTVLNGLINQRVLLLHAEDNRMIVTTEQMQAFIASLPVFQGEDGRFSLDRYEMLLRAQNMSPQMFEASLRQDLRVQQIVEAVGESAFAGTLPVRRFLEAQLEAREIRDLAVPVERFIDEVVVEADAVRAFYDSNPGRFERAPRLRAQYVVFDDNALLGRLQIDEAQVAAFYEANIDRFGLPEERRARHILIQVDGDAAEAELTAARERAQRVLDTLSEAPESFAELAAAESEDPGSASSGGDLGFFSRGAMVAEFEDAVFGREIGELGELVRSDFGFHIIEVTAIRPDSIQPLEAVRDEIVAELGRQEASRQFAVLAEQFANTVYEQPDSLEPAAELLGLEIRETDWIERGNAVVGGFSNERLTSELFSVEARESGENIEAVEVARGTLLAARVLEYQEAQRLPFEEVSEQIERQLRVERASTLAREHGEALLAQLAAGEAPALEWSTIRRIQRATPTLPQQAMQAVFAASSAELPAHVGVPVADGGFALYRIESVERAVLDDDDPRLRTVADEYRTRIADKEFDAFLASLRDQYKVEIRATALRSDNP